MYKSIDHNFRDPKHVIVRKPAQILSSRQKRIFALKPWMKAHWLNVYSCCSSFYWHECLEIISYTYYLFYVFKGICHRPKSQCFVCRENIRRAVTIFTKIIFMHLCKICTNSCTWNIKKTFSEKKRNQPEGVEKWPFRWMKILVNRNLFFFPVRFCVFALW